MFDLTNVPREELEKIIINLDNALMDLHHRSKELPGENLELRKQSEALENEVKALKAEKENTEKALYDACVELTKAYKKTGKGNPKWEDPVNWMSIFLKEE